MKKFIVVPVALCAIGIAACGGSTSHTKTVTVAAVTTPPPAATTTTATTPTTATVVPCSQITPGDGSVECDPEGSSTCPPGKSMAGGNCWSDANAGTSDPSSSDSSTTSNLKTAGRGQWLKLTTLHAKIEHVSIQHQMGSDLGVKVAHGKFVVISLSVTNHSNSPQRFDGMGDETALVLANQKTYSERFDVGNGYDQNSFGWNSDDIQPDQTATHDLIFDVPANAVVSGAHLGVLNFGDDTTTYSADDGTELGSIAVGSLA
jgi:Domain of unknown function (DUF4352)